MDKTALTGKILAKAEVLLVAYQQRVDGAITSPQFREIVDAFPSQIITEVRAATLKEVEPLIEKLFLIVEHGDYSNGITANEGSVDEGQVRAREYITECHNEWQQSRRGEMPTGKETNDG